MKKFLVVWLLGLWMFAAQAGQTVTVAVANVTTSGTVPQGTRHIEFILSTDFAGTIGGVTISGATLAIYSPGTAHVGDVFAPLPYTITAGSAIITTW